MILEMMKVDMLLNNKSEWHGSRLPRIVIEEMDRHIEDKESAGSRMEASGRSSSHRNKSKVEKSKPQKRERINEDWDRLKKKRRTDPEAESSSKSRRKVAARKNPSLGSSTILTDWLGKRIGSQQVHLPNGHIKELSNVL